MSDQYTLPTGHVRHAATEPYGTRITGPEFDTWLASVKAEAWEQGADSAYYDPEIRDQVNYPDNPYRERETTDE